MVTGCIISRVPRTVSIRSLISGSRHANQHLIPHLRHCYSFSGSWNKVIASQMGVQNSKERKELGSNEQLSIEDMAKLVAKCNELLKTNQEQIEQLKDRLHHTITEMEHLKEGIKRKEENSKKAGAQVGESKPLNMDQYNAIKESQRDTSTAIAYGTMIGAWVNAAHLEHYQLYYEKEESIKHKHDEPKDGKLEVQGRILTNSIKEEINNEDSGSDTSNGDSGSPNADWDSHDTSNVYSGSHVSHETFGYF